MPDFNSNFNKSRYATPQDTETQVTTKIRYSSNNSGGEWWLTDEDWFALEKAGWQIEWSKDQEHLGTRGERWLGALAIAATREGLSLGEAIAEWERVTGQNSNDAGCPCCGEPHYFSEE